MRSQTGTEAAKKTRKKSTEMISDQVGLIALAVIAVLVLGGALFAARTKKKD